MDLSQENRRWLEVMKNTYQANTSQASKQNTLSAMMSGLDRELKSWKLSQKHYDYLKGEINSWGGWNGGSSFSSDLFAPNAFQNNVPKPTPSIQNNPTFNRGIHNNPTLNTTTNKNLTAPTDRYLDENKAQNNFVAYNNYNASNSPNYDPNRDTPVASTNYHKEKFMADGKEYEAEAARYAKKTRENATKLGQDEQATIIQRDAEKRKRADKQEQDLTSIQNRAERNIELRRQDAEDLYRMQNDIALRNANASMAQATSSGVLMAAGEVDAIRNDTIAKYGQNILNAKDFKNKTNISLDEALTNLGLNIFKNKAEIDNFRNLLDNEQFQPVLNALKAAHEGDQKAVTDVYNYYTEFNKKKTEEDYNRMMQKERYIEDERSFQHASLQVKERMIMDKLAETPGMAYTAQDIHRIINQYPDRSFAFILATAMEQAAKNQNARDMAMGVIQSGQYKDMKGYIDPIMENNTSMIHNGNTGVEENLKSWHVAAQGNPNNPLYGDFDPHASNNPHNTTWGQGTPHPQTPTGTTNWDSSVNREQEIRNNIDNGIRNDPNIKRALQNNDIEYYRRVYGYYSADATKKAILDEKWNQNYTPPRPTYTPPPQPAPTFTSDLFAPNAFQNNQPAPAPQPQNSGLYNKSYDFFESLKNDAKWNRQQGNSLQLLMVRARNTINNKVREGVITSAQGAEMLRALQAM